MNKDISNLFQQINEIKNHINRKTEKLCLVQNQKLEKIKSEIQNLQLNISQTQKEIEGNQLARDAYQINQNLLAEKERIIQESESKDFQIKNLTNEIEQLEKELNSQINFPQTLSFVKSIAPVSIKSIDADNISGMVSYGTMDTTEFFNLPRNDPQTPQHIFQLLDALFQKL